MGLGNPFWCPLLGSCIISTTTTITCYTDGSKTDNGTGFGYTITTKNNKEEVLHHSAKIPDYCSVYQAELRAITAAATSLQDTTNKDILFLTDSLSSLQALSAGILKSRTAIECHNELIHIANKNQVILAWIPGHEDHAGNERADQLAKEGTKADHTLNGFIPQSMIKRIINEKVATLDRTEWIAKGQTHTKVALGPLMCKTHIRTIKELKNLQLNRSKYRTAIQLITGHIGLNYQLHKMGLSDTDICPKCDYTEETVSHFLGNCPSHFNHRSSILNTFISNISNIFKENNLNQIIKFVNNTGRLNRETAPHTSGVT